MTQDDLIAIAEAQAAKDRELLAAMDAKRQAVKAEQAQFVIETDNPDLMEDRTPVPMNRAQRRQRVREYAKLLAFTERQTPVVNPTIIPKNSYLRRKRSRKTGNQQHA